MRPSAASASALFTKDRLLKCDVPANIKNEKNAKSLEEAFIAIINEYEDK